jgi:hypothetical protein
VILFGLYREYGCTGEVVRLGQSEEGKGQDCE